MTMKMELRPQLRLAAVLKKCWWILIVLFMLLWLFIAYTPTALTRFSPEWWQWIMENNSNYLIIYGYIVAILLVVTYRDLSTYLLLHNTVLESRWGWKGYFLSKTVPLADMQSCTIGQGVATMDRGSYQFNGFVFEPKKPWRPIYIPMPIGVDENAQQEFLALIQNQLKPLTLESLH